MSVLDWNEIEQWAQYKASDWERIGGIVDARIGDLRQTPFGQDAAFTDLSGSELREQLAVHVAGMAAGYNMASMFSDDGKATIAQEAKVLRAVEAAASKLHSALNELGRLRRSARDHVVGDGEEFLGTLSDVMVKAESTASYLEARIRRGRPTNVKRNVYWARLRHFWTEELAGNKGRAKNAAQDPDGGLIQFIVACSSPLMRPSECDAGKVDEFLRPPRQRAKSKIPA